MFSGHLKENRCIGGRTGYAKVSFGIKSSLRSSACLCGLCVRSDGL